MRVLSEADVVCATLTGSGAPFLPGILFKFDTVIIDEACQSVEVSALIPLQFQCSRCILVGDQLQLPPTLISPTARNADYDRSLFVRILEHAPDSAHLLSSMSLDSSTARAWRRKLDAHCTKTPSSLLILF